jgi:LPXTG-motif cell wall-anchored protein
MLFSGTLFFSPVKIVLSNPYTDIDVVTAYDMITNGSYPNLIILDVRTQSEYDERHIENSMLIPVTELESRINELSQYIDTEIVVYCRTGWESAGYPIIPIELPNTTMFPTWLIIVIFLIATFAVIILLKKKKTSG